MSEKSCPKCFSYLKNGKCPRCGYVDTDVNEEQKTSKFKHNFLTFCIAFGISIVICYLFLFIGFALKSNLGNFFISFYEHPLRVIIATLYLTYRIRDSKFKWYDILIALLLMFLVDVLIVIGRIL